MGFKVGFYLKIEDIRSDMFGALDGLRVIELGQLIAGPFCGQLMADHGAEVIKVEQPGSGDPMRWALPYSLGRSGQRSVRRELACRQSHTDAR